MLRNVNTNVGPAIELVGATSVNYATNYNHVVITDETGMTFMIGVDVINECLKTMREAHSLEDQCEIQMFENTLNDRVKQIKKEIESKNKN